MTYKGDRPIISSNTAMLITDIALKIANFTMFQKIANCLSIISFLMVASMTATGVIGYKYVTSENFKSQVMNCRHCKTELIWGGDIDIDESMPIIK